MAFDFSSARPCLVLAAMLALAGCASPPENEGVVDRTYPLSGQVMMAEGTGTLHVVSSQLALNGVRFQIDNSVRVRREGESVGICTSYIYRGPEALWRDVEVDYPRMAALGVTPPSGENGDEAVIGLEHTPGYRLVPGVPMGVAELKQMPMQCVVTDLPWAASYEDKGPSLRVLSRDKPLPKLSEQTAALKAATPVGQVFRDTLDTVDYSLAVATRLIRDNDRVKVCALARVAAAVDLQAAARQALSAPGATLTITPKAGGAPIVLAPDFIPVLYGRAGEPATVEAVAAEMIAGDEAKCRVTERLWREDLGAGQYAMQLVPLVPDQRLRTCAVIGAQAVSCPSMETGWTPRLIDWKVGGSQPVGTQAGDVVETIPTALARQKVTLVSAIRTFDDNGRLGVCGALVLAAPQGAMSQLADLLRQSDTEVVIGGGGPKPVRLSPAFMHKYTRLAASGVMGADELHFPRLVGDCVTVATAWRSEYLSSATFRPGAHAEPLYPLAPQ